MTEVGNICKQADIDSYKVVTVVGFGDYICAAFIRSGLSWGASCFPRMSTPCMHSRANEYASDLLDAIVNDLQPDWMVDFIRKHIDFNGARVAILGLAFKPEIDDVRTSRSFDLVPQLDEAGTDVVSCGVLATEKLEMYLSRHRVTRSLCSRPYRELTAN